VNYFILYLFMSFMTLCKAQNGSVTYSYFFNSDSNNIIKYDIKLYFNSTQSINHMAYHKSKNYDLDKRIEKDKTITEGNNVTITTTYIDTTSSIYYRDLRSQKFFCREPGFVGFKKYTPFLYEDEGAQHLPWVLKDDYKTISDYKCQKAIVDFRGRRYEAWFTTEIPLPFGPWKLGGLPGLILEVYDLSKEISFTAISINIPDPAPKNKILKPEGTKITHKEFVALEQNRTDKVHKAILSKLPKGAIFVSSKTIKNPIESEFEWNKE